MENIFMEVEAKLEENQTYQQSFCQDKSVTDFNTSI